MDGVSDHPFRHIQKKYGQPALVYTEFTSVEGLCHGATRLLKDFLFDETQRPIIGQIYGSTPAYFYQAAIILCELGFDGVDINMGCPAKNVAHSGAGAALIKTPKLAQEIIAAVQAGIKDWTNGKTIQDCPDVIPNIQQAIKIRHAELPTAYQTPRVIPVSVKTRVGYDQPVINEWIPTLLEMNPAAIALHGRTLKQQYGGLANWEIIGQAAELIHKTETKILGNGDIHTHAEALDRISTYQLDGVLIGRGSMGNPFIFQTQIPPHTQLFKIALEHAHLFETTFKDDEKYNFMPMRKHLGWYVKDIPNAAQIRIELFKTNSAQEVEQVFSNHHLI
jgi:tRNA-dihydrouridine synthase B